MFVAKQDIKSVPLHLITEAVYKAGSEVEARMIKAEETAYDIFISKKDKEWNDTHEAPFEGNFRDIYPFEPPNEEHVLAAKKTAQDKALIETIKTLGIKAKASWFLPQMTAYIAKMKLPYVDGKINGEEFRSNNFGSDAWHRGLWLLGTVPQRGAIVPSQSAPEYVNYAAFVPLLMMPFKKFDRVPYSSWNKDTIRFVVDKELLLAMSFEGEFDMSLEDIMTIRAQGLKVNTGKDEGTLRNPLTYHKLYNLAGTPLEGAPWLVQDMVTQIWGAHPVNRTNLMILDWKNWDNMPPALIADATTSKDISKPAITKVTTVYDW